MPTDDTYSGLILMSMPVCIECGGIALHNLRGCEGYFVDTLVPLPSYGDDGDSHAD